MRWDSDGAGSAGGSQPYYQSKSKPYVPTQVRAPCAGTVTALAALAGAQVGDGHVLAVVVPHGADQAAAAA